MIQTPDYPVPLYRKGQTVYAAQTTTEERQHPCPDCLGTGTWNIKTPAGAEMTCSCVRCRTRYTTLRTTAGEVIPSLTYCVSIGRVLQLTIGQIRIQTATRHNPEEVAYMCEETGIGSGSVWNETNLHPTPESAQEAADQIAAHETAQIRAQPQAMRANHFSDLSVRAAFAEATWEALYRAWDQIRPLNDFIDDLLERKALNEDDVYAADDLKKDREWLHPHPLEALVAAAEHSTDPVVCKVYADLAAQFPRPIAAAVEERIS